MDRRRFIGALVGGSILAAPLAAGAQQAGKVYRIGVLVPGSSAAAAPFVGVFGQGLRELGFVEGKNLVIELRYAETPVLLAQHADELTRLGVDVVVGTATPAALALKRATRTIPIVMGTASDPVQAGPVESLARPGGNLRQRPDALLVLVDPQIFFRFARIADFALSHKLTSISFYREFPESGGLMSYGPSLIGPARVHRDRAIVLACAAHWRGAGVAASVRPGVVVSARR